MTTPTHVHACFLKGDYVTSDVPSGHTIDDCHHYTIWEAGPDWDKHYKDSQYQAAAGPVRCGNFVAESVQSVAVVTMEASDVSVVVAASPSQ